MKVELRAALNAQVNRELASAFAYLAMSMWLESCEYAGFARWLLAQFYEELEHAGRIATHLNERGVAVTIDTLERPQEQYGSAHETFCVALEHEQRVTESIGQLESLAHECEDHAAHEMLQWFVAEQRQEEETLEDVISRLACADEEELRRLDDELGQRDLPCHDRGTGSTVEESVAKLCEEVLGQQPTSRSGQRETKEVPEMEYPGIDPNVLLAKMNNGKDDDKTLWLFLFMMILGRRGFGGVGDDAGAGGALGLKDLLYETRNSVLQTTCNIGEDINGAVQLLSDKLGESTCRTVDAIRDTERAVVQQSGDIKAAIAECCCKLGMSIKDVEQAIAKCCCETQLAIKDLGYQNQLGFCGVQSAICDQTNTLVAAGTTNTQRIVDKLSSQELTETRDRAARAELELSNCNQTRDIISLVAKHCGGCSDNGGHNGGGHRSWAEVAASSGWAPPGQAKK